ncbi:hypothetical protein SLEP1_g2723 [Rubroshorea leprosula]|nr:hypothetical protein SLEP1_g2723 [Rubroshorea leprosula]
MTKEHIEKLLKAGANVILTTKRIDDMALKTSFFISFLLCGGWGYCCETCPKRRYVVKATGETMGEETFDSSLLEYADEVVECIADDDVIIYDKGDNNYWFP